MKTRPSLKTVSFHVPLDSAAAKSLRAAGMPDELLSILPPEEAARYGNVVSIQSHSEDFELDSGRLRLPAATVFLPDGFVRAISGYRWLEEPRHTFSDAFRPDIDIQYGRLSQR